jgi:hypothetical protein
VNPPASTHRSCSDVDGGSDVEGRFGSTLAQQIEFRDVVRALDCSVERVNGISVTSEPAEEITARGVKKVIAVELSSERVDRLERTSGTVAFRDSDCTVERDDGRELYDSQLVVERNDLVPISVGRDVGVAVHRGDRSLDLVRARPVPAQTRTHNRLSFDNEIAIPARPILIAETNERAVPRCARGAP